MPASDSVIAGFNHSFMIVSLSVGVMRGFDALITKGDSTNARSIPSSRSAARSLSRALLHESREFLKFLVVQVGDHPIGEIARNPLEYVVAVPGGTSCPIEPFTLAWCYEHGEVTELRERNHKR